MLDFSVTFFITILNVTILYFVLKRILFKPVTAFMASRTARIQGDFDRAAADRAKADRLLADYEGKLAAVEEEAEGIRAEARAAAVVQAEVIVEKAKAEAAALLEAARAQIAGERAAEAVRFRRDAAAIVVAATSRLLGREADSEDARRSAEAFVAEAETA